jgi:type I restriction-modification system DNA methylase subunit
MARIELQQAVLDILRNLRGLEPLKQLFWSELNYDRVNQPLSRHGWSDTAAKALAEDPILFAGGGENNDFHVIYARLASDRFLLGQERPVASRLLRDHPYTLFVFSNSAQDRWHFINIKYETETEKRRRFRRITVGPEERLRTASERLSLLDLSAIGRELFGLSPLAIQECHDKAFDVEEVTKQFFNEYRIVFDDFQRDLSKQTNDKSWAHDYSLQFLNRCMFLYFIQRKGWLGEDREFLRTFWETYRGTAQPVNSFVNKWIKVLFFEAFNRKFHRGHRHFPEKIKNTLSRAPFLNGGLFTENELDTKNDFLVTDDRFEQIFKFLERYNFTIAEDSPLDQEVAVDPEVIGKVYESLVNISEEADERGDAGIFYTPRTEIDLMCRLALVDHLSNHLGNESRSLFYQLIFALESNEKADADKAFSHGKLWPALNHRLHEITILDPACGSGSFLVGMLHILDNLQERANRHLNIKETPYDRKKRIIGQSLYGVDVKDWACHVAELRLWLALVVDAELTIEDLHIRREPLLPHFTFKIRCGDSLVQELGGINFGHIRQDRDIPKEIQTRIAKLKTEKLKFYDNYPDCQFKSPNQVKREELRLFQDILEVRRHKIQEEIKSLRRKIEGPIQQQIRLDGKIEGKPRQIELDSVKWQKQVEILSIELSRIDSAREALKPKAEIPFVWDIAFVEIFESEKEGFDIVIGNPPYVRQENIADPHLPREDVTSENKKEYKGKLARSVYQAFPNFFGYKPETDAPAHKLDAKSDLYIYFYFHGLSLLNPKGSFCLITSNSWLDVGYGKDLQEFLLKHSHIKMILDNQAKRSFAQADVNTVIVLFSAPDDRRDWALDKTARFVMFKAPFEHILSPVIFDEIEATDDRKVTPEYRTFPAVQKTLLEDGWEWPEDADEESKKRFGFTLKGSKYGGNKWGGKYLRAPDIYWTILEKGKGKLVAIEPDIGRVLTVAWSRQGHNKEIMVSNTDAGRGEKIPVLKSPREFDGIIIRSNNVKTFLKIGLVEKNQIVRTPLVWDDIRGERHICRLNQDLLAFTHNFHGIQPKNASLAWFICACLNSTLAWLFVETLGRRGLGGGGIRILVQDMKMTPLLIHPDCFSSRQIKNIRSAFDELSSRPIHNVSIELMNDKGDVSPKTDRYSLDSIIFDVLGLVQDERNAVYQTVVSLVADRLKKASSLDPKDRQKRSVMGADVED